MDFTKIAKITIELEALQDLLNKQTGNSIANEDIPEILRKAIQSGFKVLLMDINGRNTCVLRLKDDGGFVYESPA